MKKHLILIAYLLAVVSARAQTFSAGVRGGIGYWMQGSEHFGYQLKAAPGTHLSAVPGGFVRYNLKKRFAFEASVSTARMNYRMFNDYPNASGLYYSDWSCKNYVGSISVQYELVCPYLKKCPLLRKVHSYAGISANPILQKHSMEKEAIYNNDITRTEYQFWMGVSHTLSYDLTTRFSIMSVADFIFRPVDILRSYETLGEFDPTAKLGFNIGASYRF